MTVGKGNVQAEARRARYAALAEAARRHGSVAVVTGHTATDQTETVLMNLVRGAGLRGLGGMPPRRPLSDDVDLVRPLLGATRAEVEAEARARGWTWRDDPGNAVNRFQRNRIRQAVLPLLEAEGGPGTASRIARAADAARAALAVVPALLDAHGAGGRLALDVFRPLPPDVRRAVWAEALRRWAPDAPRSAGLVARIDALLDAPVGQRVEAGGAAVWRERDALAFVSATLPAQPVAVGADGTARLASGTFRASALDAVPAAFSPDPHEETVDADRVPCPLAVRPWRDGDRIRPLGMEGSRLVSDLLRDARVPPSGRRAVPVVEGGGEVLWVVGHRLSASVAVTEATRRAARWAWAPVVAPGGAG